MAFTVNRFEEIKISANSNVKRINIKMSNIDMRIAITMKNNLPLNRNGFFVDVKDLSNLTLPSFTKKIINTIR